MTKFKKSWLIFILAVTLMLLLINLYIYCTPPGLHFLLIFFDAVVLLIAGVHFLLITAEIEKYWKIGIAIVTSALMTGLPIIIDDKVGIWTTRIGFLTTVISLVGSVWIIYSFRTRAE